MVVVCKLVTMNLSIIMWKCTWAKQLHKKQFKCSQVTCPVDIRRTCVIVYDLGICHWILTSTHGDCVARSVLWSGEAGRRVRFCTSV